MKYGRFLAIVLIFCVVLSGMAFADEPVSDPVESPSVLDEEVLVIEEVTLEEAFGEDYELYAFDDPVVMGYSLYEPTERSERSESTIASAVVSVFGEYEPTTHTVTDHLSDGTSVTYEQVVPGLAGVDWVWVSGVGIFALMLYSIFRLMGVFLR